MHQNFRNVMALHAVTDNPDVLHSLYIATDIGMSQNVELYCITDCYWGRRRCAAGFWRSTKHECKTVLLLSMYMKTCLHLAVICPATTCVCITGLLQAFTCCVFVGEYVTIG